jgi:glycosyltransferase involved in cell wall biosynthesis
MKVLIVCSKNSGRVAPFILEQVDSLIQMGVEIEYFTIEHKGIKGYLKCYYPLLKKIKEFNPDILHAHYGLSGLLANLQRKVPVVTTYLGSDINSRNVYYFSRVSMMLSAYNIFVSDKNSIKSRQSKNKSLIPYGLKSDLFIPMNKEVCRDEHQLIKKGKYVIFAGSLQNPIKNPELAIKSVEMLGNVALLSLGKGYTREQVVSLMNAADVALMTSFSEGSPQFIKEAMACNLPIVSVPVGDVSEIMNHIDGCYICTYQKEDVAEKLKMALDFGKRTNGRHRILELGLDSETVAKKIIEVYQQLTTNH